jgi:CopG family nickel-responsive transcriptional regulator
LVVISLSIPDELLELLDRVTESGRRATRSEVVRQALNSYISEYRSLERLEGEVVATITVLHEKSDRGQDLNLQHEFDDIVVQYHHTHLSKRTCLEMMVVKGNSMRLKEFMDGLKADMHVKQLKCFVMSDEGD